MEFISFRSKEELRKAAAELARLERRDQSDEYREIFSVGIAEKRKTVAIDNYSRGETSLGKSAEIAGITTWEFLDLMRERRVPFNLSAKEILEQAEGA